MGTPSQQRHKDGNMLVVMLSLILVLVGIWLIAWGVSSSKKKKPAYAPGTVLGPIIGPVDSPASEKVIAVVHLKGKLIGLAKDIKKAIAAKNAEKVEQKVSKLEELLSKSPKDVLASVDINIINNAVIAVSDGMEFVNSKVPVDVKPVLEKVAQALPGEKRQLIKQAKESFGIDIAEDQPQMEGFGGRGGRGGRGGWGRGGRGGWGGWGGRRWWGRGRGLGWRYVGMPAWNWYYPQCFLRTPGLECPALTAPSADGVYCCSNLGYNFYA